jgi:hypothetical protein
MPTMGQKANFEKPPCMQTVAIASDADGNGVATMGPFTGFLDSVHFAKGDLADTADFTITVARTAQAVAGAVNLTASKTVRPRITPQGVTGADLTALTFLEPVYLFNDTLNVALAEGGVSKSGTVTALIRK